MLLGITSVGQLLFASFLLVIAPGPGQLSVLIATAKGGRPSGFAAMLATVTGDSILILLSSLGVAALLKSTPWALQVIQYVGAGYLAYLGLDMVIPKEIIPHVLHHADDPMTPLLGYKRSLAIALTNPYALIFFMTFFPLFLDTTVPLKVSTFVVMALLYNSVSSSYLSSVVLIGNAVFEHLKNRPKLAAWGNRVAGFLLMAFAMKLAANM